MAGERGHRRQEQGGHCRKPRWQGRSGAMLWALGWEKGSPHCKGIGIKYANTLVTGRRVQVVQAR